MKGKYLIAVAFLASWTVIAANTLPFILETQDACPAVDLCPPKLISYEADCSKYYECQNGQPQLRSCAAGYYFSMRWRGCVDRSISDCLIPEPECPVVDTCPPKLISHADCSKYYECQNGRPQLRSCAGGYYFSMRWRGCVDRSISDCTSNPPTPPTPPTPTPPTPPTPPTQPTPPTPTPPTECTRDGDKLRHECECTKFYECKSGRKALRQCPPNHVFRPSSSSCEVGTDCDDHPTKPTPTDPECTEGELLAHECQCNKYYQCKNGRKALRECNPGMHFDKTTKACVPGESCGECSTGDARSHDCDCDKYYKCHNEEWILEHCTNGEHFSNSTKTCMDPLKAKCDPDLKYPGTCPPDSLPAWPHECDCRLYYKCEDEIKVIHSCTWGQYFDRVKMNCDVASNIKDTCKNLWDDWVQRF